MTEHNLLEHIGLPATSYKEDARLWQWFSNGVDDGRLECSRKDDVWSIGVAGRDLTRNRSLNDAVKSAYAR